MNISLAMPSAVREFLLLKILRLLVVCPCYGREQSQSITSHWCVSHTFWCRELGARQNIAQIPLARRHSDWRLYLFGSHPRLPPPEIKLVVLRLGEWIADLSTNKR